MNYDFLGMNVNTTFISGKSQKMEEKKTKRQQQRECKWIEQCQRDFFGKKQTKPKEAEQKSTNTRQYL